MVKQHIRKKMRKQRPAASRSVPKTVNQELAMNVSASDLLGNLKSTDTKIRSVACLVLMNLLTEQSPTSESYVSNNDIMALVAERIVDPAPKIRHMAIGIVRAVAGWAPSSVLAHLEQTHRMFTQVFHAANEAFTEVQQQEGVAGARDRTTQANQILLQTCNCLANAAVSSQAVTDVLSSADPSKWAPLSVQPILLAAKLAVPSSSTIPSLNTAAANLLAVLLEDNTQGQALIRQAPGAGEALVGALKEVVALPLTGQLGQQVEALGVELACSVYQAFGPQAVDSVWIEAMRRALARDPVVLVGEILRSEKEASALLASSELVDEAVVGEDGEDLLKGEKLVVDEETKTARKQQQLLDAWTRDVDASRTALEALLTLTEEAQEEQASARKGKAKQETPAAAAARQTLTATGLAVTLFTRLSKLSELPASLSLLKANSLIDEAQALIAYATTLTHAVAVIAAAAPAVRGSVRKPSVLSQVLAAGSAAVRCLLETQQDEKLPAPIQASLAGPLAELVEGAFRVTAELCSAVVEEGGIAADASPADVETLKASVLSVCETALLLTVTPTPPVTWTSALAGEEAERLVGSWNSARAMAVSLTSLLGTLLGAAVLPVVAAKWVEALQLEVAKGHEQCSAVVLAELCDGFFERFGDEDNDAALKAAGLVPALEAALAVGKVMVKNVRIMKRTGREIEAGVERLNEEIIPNLGDYIKYKKSHGV